ncbi:hypothetical protein KUV85_12525 [Nocardioides panacisoli]|uniref:hypothetical protein n=1 Tax=Nocardioides panacisoli TaxID=627624 RepID=UPI001C634D5B|nr:hypothetical protein [Nocardioides panacisoli]QYJ03156.1 hypothetical protein KUV85_12525 [Nocardioides panacisoli]
MTQQAAPTRSSPSRAEDPVRRAVVRGGAVAVAMVLLLVAAVVVLHFLEEEPDTSYGLTELEEHLAQHPGVPIELPEALPPAYEWRGVQDWTKRRGRVTQRSSQFAPIDAGSAAPLVQVCVERSRAAGQCPVDDEGIQRSDGGRRVMITFAGGEPNADQLEFWQRVPLTADPAEVDWLE